MSQATQDRRWEVNLDVDEFGRPDDRRFEEDVEREALKVAAILLRLGGAIQTYAVRQQDPQSQLWFPIKVVFKWQSFVPGVRAPVATPAPQEPPVDVEPEPEQQASDPAREQLTEPVEEPDGNVMVGPGGERASVPPDEMQDYLKAGWRPLAEVEAEGAEA